MAKHITLKQKQVYETIENYIYENDEAPTLSELQDMLEIKTKRGVVKHLEALETKGLIYRTSKTRGIVLTNNPHQLQTLSIPILGYANAGQPLVFAEEEIMGLIQVDPEIVKTNRDLFALVVKGDSMNMKEINKVPLTDKNYVIVDKNGEYRDGDTVLAVVDNAATIKSYKRSQNSVILYPESSNPIHTPIYLKEDSSAFINGKVIAVLENPMG